MKIRTAICPICGKTYNEPPALSRRNNEDICPACGTEEALEDARLLIAPHLSDEQWTEYKESIKAISLKQCALQGTM